MNRLIYPRLGPLFPRFILLGGTVFHSGRPPITKYRDRWTGKIFETRREPWLLGWYRGIPHAAREMMARLVFGPRSLSPNDYVILRKRYALHRSTHGAERKWRLGPLVFVLRTASPTAPWSYKTNRPEFAVYPVARSHCPYWRNPGAVKWWRSSTRLKFNKNWLRRHD